jgi:ribosome maturation factor RimP
MAIKDQIAELVTPALAQSQYFLEDVNVVSPGNHRIVTCIVDGEAALNLDQVTDASKIISALLDEAAFMGETPFTLEVTSPGTDRPLTLPRHFSKNRTRLLKVTLNDGSVVTGRITENSETTVTLEVTEKKITKSMEIAFLDIKRAVVEIEFNRKDEI